MTQDPRLGQFEELGVRLFQGIMNKCYTDSYLDIFEDMMDPIEDLENETEYDVQMDRIMKKVMLRLSKALANWAENKPDRIVHEAEKRSGVRR